MAKYDAAMLVAWRRESGLRREDVCSQLHISFNWLARTEAGATSPTLANLAKLAEFYGHQVGELFPAEPAEVAS